MFLHRSVILSRGWGSLYDITSYLASWSHVPLRRSLSRWPLCRGSLSKGVSVQESLSRGLCPGVSVQGGLCRETPSLQSEKQMVRILLECFLAVMKFLKHDCEHRSKFRQFYHFDEVRKS